MAIEQTLMCRCFTLDVLFFIGFMTVCSTTTEGTLEAFSETSLNKFQGLSALRPSWDTMCDDMILSTTTAL